MNGSEVLGQLRADGWVRVKAEDGLPIPEPSSRVDYVEVDASLRTRKLTGRAAAPDQRATPLGARLAV